MAGVKLYGKDLSAYDDIDVDALLLTLNEDELEQLGAELIDPDVSNSCCILMEKNVFDKLMGYDTEQNRACK